MMHEWKLTLGAGFTPGAMGWEKPRHYPFRWLAELRLWVWRNLNMFPGILTGKIERVLDNGQCAETKGDR